MNHLYKVAKQFQKKLALASANNFLNLKSIYQESNKLGRLFQDLWMAANNDPYSDFNPRIGKAVDKIARIGRNAYYQAINYGMPPQGQYGFAAFLNNMNKAIQELDSLGPFRNIDPIAINSLGKLKSHVSKAEAEFTPIAIPPTKKQQTITVPEVVIKGDPPAGAAYEAQEPLMTPDEGIEDPVTQTSRPITSGG